MNRYVLASLLIYQLALVKFATNDEKVFASFVMSVAAGCALYFWGKSC